MKFGEKNRLLNSLDNYRAEGESALSSLYGRGEDDYDGDDDYDGEDRFVGGAQRKQLGIGSIDPNARVISLLVVNANATTAKKVKLFGGYANAGASNQGNDTDITVTCDTVPYAQLLEQTKSNPMLLKEVKFIASGANPTPQLAEKISLTHTDATGKVTIAPYFPNLHLSPYQNIANMIEDKNFEFTAAGDSSLEFNMQPGTSLKIVTFIKAQTDMGRVVNGKSALEVTNASAPIGKK